MIIIYYLVLVILGLTVVVTAVVSIYVVVNILFILFVTQVPPVQTERQHFNAIFSQFRINSESVIYDIGCGGGNFLMAAAQFEPKKCVGYELSLFPFLQALIKSWFQGRGLARVYFKNFFRADLSDADFVYVYLVPPLLGRVAQKLKHELKPGAMVIVKGCPLPEISYVNKITLDAKRDYYAFVYKF